MTPYKITREIRISHGQFSKINLYDARLKKKTKNILGAQGVIIYKKP